MFALGGGRTLALSDRCSLLNNASAVTFGRA